ncbi:MAG: iron ABC transporter permease [Spirochaetaceae bacterium]|jgi:iron complex transport system permease protein|nr:iron ABC transporter permease [Spirochaetaceae bacterium]
MFSKRELPANTIPALGNKTKLLAAFFTAFFFICLGASLGSTGIRFSETLSIVSRTIFFLPLNDTDPKTVFIVLNIRLPRVLLAFLAGGCLSVSGLITQSILKNQLASPYILGVSSGASLGAALVLLGGFVFPLVGAFTLPFTGFIGAMLTVFLVVSFSSKLDKTISNNTIILFGMVFSLFVNALLTTLFALYREELKNLIVWQMGSFANKGWSYIRILLPFLVTGLLGLMYYAKEMDILSFGDEQASAIGVEVQKLKRNLLICSAILTGSAVSLCGAIGFVDLIAPHIARKIVGSRHKILIPIAFLAGGSLCVSADIIARIIVSPSELPVGAITALIGTPFFIWVYFKKSR